MDLTLRLGIGSIVVSLATLGLKYLAFAITGSIALYSDALESLVNVATAVATLLAVRLSLQPADSNHPYGHHKVEYFSAVFAGVLIVVAALMILREAWGGFLAPRMPDAPFKGVAISLVATAVNATWAFLLIRLGGRRRSPALVADGRHLAADVVTSVGVVAGIVLAALTGWAILDPALAAAVALNILWSGWTVIRDSLGGLMDAAVPDETLAAIRAVISAEAEGALEAHDVRTRQAGSAVFVEFHLVVPAEMTVAESHAICDRIEAALRRDIAGVRPVIHVEPDFKAKHNGGVPVL
ncbi:cation diffusion facilitator family transporter [Amaricoccus sp.]|uniref:cation diffusion facilitator family transporter n=1 Tax=Amaricoccus sp. TaxID=1872485 RepID=UPI001B480709|nr:cation diffusion facilitator family transporter [Amaricoccus sp.]MBP7001846.1 cation transporter [Amaricoccus sp.]